MLPDVEDVYLLLADAAYEELAGDLINGLAVARHTDIVKKLTENAPALLLSLFDGLTWRCAPIRTASST